ncbi:hypothetical protein Val02_47480 [Virgisporangium aliadipatigenens]|uniref:Uncharacterized protein n=1 Tax=Virgisporangium aliadipatigenens TaxID=741659 RepID=A0A8J4DT41_9ACTN|nr:hypothetical protein [Virgisporangium aliadipatigenens]GIJ47862.1 hypothetical protein Val02_47480 [Virgisporangium aliadipatigenens]
MTDDDALHAEELVPGEGEWQGLLFENPTLGLKPALTWGLRIPFGTVDRDRGDTPVSLDVEWLPLAVPDWRSLTGGRVTSTEFAEPAEASLYYFAHHRYRAVEVRVLAQEGTRLRVRVAISGDLDGLGVESFAVEAWVRFTGIVVSLRDTGSTARALERLGEFTATDALVPDGDAAHPFPRFVPA